jgi:dTDP-4-amino-4,6-dideoxygalactose transaminase
MIPRVQPNYSFSDLLSSFFVRENTYNFRKNLILQLNSYFNNKNILLTHSGRGALFAILSCLDQKNIFVPAYTCKAVIEACRLAQKNVFYIETEDNGFNADPQSLAGSLNSDSVLLITHQFGYPCQVDQLLELANNAGAVVVEDCAASLGVRYNGRLTGSFGLAAAFSFDSTKLLNAPLKGGFMLTADQDFYLKCQKFIDENLKKLPFSLKIYYLLMGLVLKIIGHHFLYKIFHWLMFQRKGHYTDERVPSSSVLTPFYKYGLAEFQAAIVSKQFKYLDQILAKRRRDYNIMLTGLRPSPLFASPPPLANDDPAPIRFCLQIKGDKFSFYERCVKKGLDLGFSFTFIASPSTYEKSHRLANSILNLPFYFTMPDKTIKNIIYIINKITEEG